MNLISAFLTLVVLGGICLTAGLPVVFAVGASVAVGFAVGK